MKSKTNISVTIKGDSGGCEARVSGWVRGIRIRGTVGTFHLWLEPADYGIVHRTAQNRLHRHEGGQLPPGAFDVVCGAITTALEAVPC